MGLKTKLEDRLENIVAPFRCMKKTGRDGLYKTLTCDLANALVKTETDLGIDKVSDRYSLFYDNLVSEMRKSDAVYFRVTPTDMKKWLNYWVRFAVNSVGKAGYLSKRIREKFSLAELAGLTVSAAINLSAYKKFKLDDAWDLDFTGAFLKNGKKLVVRNRTGEHFGYGKELDATAYADKVYDIDRQKLWRFALDRIKLYAGKIPGRFAMALAPVLAAFYYFNNEVMNKFPWYSSTSLSYYNFESYVLPIYTIGALMLLSGASLARAAHDTYTMGRFRKVNR